MKKYLMSLLVILSFVCSAKAQMADTLGALAIGGAIGAHDAQMMARGQGALNTLRFQDDLTQLIMNMQMYGADMSAPIDKNMIQFKGFNGVDWDISRFGSETVIEFRNLNAPLCFVCRNNAGSVNRVEINDGGSCAGNNNHVKMFF